MSATPCGNADDLTARDDWRAGQAMRLLTVAAAPVATGPGVLVLVVLVVEVIVGSVIVGGIVVVSGLAGICISASLSRQFRTQPVKVRAAAVVLELASNLYLLGLGSAAPHWLDPLERPEPVRPHDASVTGVSAT
jgi:hypothetical protein